jgi:hypothetical protein
MIRIIIISLLIVNALFWGLYPHDSEFCTFIKMIGIPKCPNKIVHLLMGVFFYILAIIVAQYFT